MEVIAVSSAIYGLVLSMIICVTAVAIFTGHVVLLLVIVFTIVGKDFYVYFHYVVTACSILTFLNFLSLSFCVCISLS